MIKIERVFNLLGIYKNIQVNYFIYDSKLQTFEVK
jgi:hypothetical protein